ncbi:MAG TPA: CHAD domain-containing protein [Allosphingosinicella sp.]|jgi:inorganic triphosphatase YgiF
MAREIELKFEAAPGARNLILDTGVLDGAKARRTRQETIYFDTKSGSVRRRGFSLRIRRSGKKWVQTVKHRTDSPAGLFSRDEWEVEVRGPELDFDAVDKTPLGRFLTPSLRKKLRPFVRTSFERTTWRLSRGASRIDVTLDEGEVAAGGSEMPIVELELELGRGDRDALFELAEQVGRVVPLRLGVLSKAERGFGIADGRFDKAAKAEPVRLTGDMKVCDAFAAAAHSCLRHFRLNEPLVLARRDAPALHQARVAVRRLRSALSLFRPVISDWEYERMREDLRWLAGALGEARNLDVLLARLPSRKVRRGSAAKIERAREAAYDKVLEVLDSARSRRLMLDLIRWFETGGWRARRRATKPLEGFAAEQLARRWTRVLKRSSDLAGEDAETLHRLRLDIKKLRYSAEFLSGVWADRAGQAKAKAFIDALADLQDRLGELNDAETARDLVGGLGLGARAQVALTGGTDGDASTSEATLAAAIDARRRLVEAAGYWTAAS